MVIATSSSAERHLVSETFSLDPALFDYPNLVSAAGLVRALRLAESACLYDGSGGDLLPAGISTRRIEKLAQH